MHIMKNLIIIGLSKTADHVFNFVKFYNLFNVVGFAVNERYKTCSKYHNLPVFSLENLEEEYGSGNFCVFVALLWNHLNRDRKELYNYCKSKNWEMVNLISPTAIIRGNILGDNCWIHDSVIIQNDAELESNISIMAQTLIGANTHICSHCFFGAKSLLGGGSFVGEQTFVGINSVIFDDTRIGDKCIIGACTAVKRNMPNFSRYITSSDNFIINQYTEEEVENKLIFNKNVR